MARIDESGLAGKTRDRPINDRLRQVLLAAAVDADVDVVSIQSGGQPGSGGQRLGSHRHDDGNAADLDLIRNGRTLQFTDSRDLETFKAFVTSAAAHGANGIGGAEGYMGPTRIHVGFGNGPRDTAKIVWGAQGAPANAPPWLRAAAQLGWSRPAGIGADIPEEPALEHFPEGETMTDVSDVLRFRALLDFIAQHEVGTAGDKGYNTSLDFGAHLPGGREQILVARTLDQIDQLQSIMLRTSKSSAMGRYQIVRTTLRDLRKSLGLNGGDLYSQALQDRLGATLVKRRGRSVDGLRNEWESLKRVSAAEILAKYDERGAVEDLGLIGEAPTTPSSVADLLQLILGRLPAGKTADRVDGDWPALQQGVGNQDAAVKRLQTTLNELRYYTGGADGKFGPMTGDAVALFQLHNGLPVTGDADTATWMALTNGSARPLTEDRITVDAGELRKMGSQTIRNADFTRYASWIAGALGVGGLTRSGACTMDPTLSSTICQTASATAATQPTSLNSLLQNVDVLQKLLGTSADPNLTQITQTLGTVQQALQGAVKTAAPVAQQALEQANSSGLTSLLTSSLVGLLPGGWAGSLAALGIGVAVNAFGNRIIQRRVADQREGKNIGVRTA